MNNAGLPGAGMGGIFYIMLAFLMPFIEIGRSFNGKSDRSRWKIVARQLFVAGGIFAGIEAAGWLLVNVFHLRNYTIKIDPSGTGIVKQAFSLPLVFPLLSLGTIILVIFLWATIKKWIKFIGEQKEDCKQINTTVTISFEERLAEIQKRHRTIPFTKKIILEKEQFIAITEYFKDHNPEESGNQFNFAMKRDRIMAQVHNEAFRILQLAHEKADELIEHEEIIQKARIRAEQIVNEAEIEAQRRSATT